jgi:hypothetical protein
MLSASLPYQLQNYKKRMELLAISAENVTFAEK